MKDTSLVGALTAYLRIYFRLSLSWCLILIVITCFFACRFSKHNSRSEDHFIQIESLGFQRLDSQVSAKLSFRSKSPGLCELKVYPLHLPVEQRGNQSRTLPCQNQSPRSDYVEILSDLKKDVLYAVEISAWPIGSSIKDADRVEVLENNGKGLGDEFYVARFNLPLRAGEVHQHSSEERVSLQSALAPFTKIGCREEPAEENLPFSSGSSNQKLSKLMVDGFYTAEAKVHPSEKTRLRFLLNNFNPGESLRFSYDDEHGSDQSFSTPQFARFVDLSVIEPERVLLSQSYLSASPYRIKVKAPYQLRISWHATPINSYSFVKVRAGLPNQKNSFVCTYPSELSQGTIPFEPFFSKFEPGEIELSISHVQFQIQQFPGAKNSPWLLAAYDWRTLRVERI